MGQAPIVFSALLSLVFAIGFCGRVFQFKQAVRDNSGTDYEKVVHRAVPNLIQALYSMGTGCRRCAL